MTDELAALIESVRGYKMTPEEKFEQRVSMIYGLGGCERETKDEIRRHLIEFEGRPPAL
jgi:hypothetical protein